MLNLLLWVKEKSWLVPVVGIVGPAPAYYSLTLALRLLRPFVSARTIACLDDAMYDSYQSLILFFMETASGVKISLHGDVKEVREKKESVLFICNHQSSMDWAVADMVAVRQGSLGHLRYVLKSDLQYVPLYGWYFWLHGSVYVRRAGSFKAERSAAQLHFLATVPPLSWLVLFPEGTRFGSEKTLRKSREYAEARGYAPLTHVLFPRVKGAHLVLQSLHGLVWFTDFATAPKGSELAIHTRRWAVGDIPRDEAGLERWLYQRFQEKDELLGEYLGTGRMREEVVGESVVSGWVSVPALLLWWLLVLPFYLTRPGRKAALAIATLGSAANIAYVKALKAV